MNYGSMPIDKGFLTLTAEEKTEAIHAEPDLEPYIRRYIGGDELLNGLERYCFWFVGVSPRLLRASAFAADRIKQCREFRLQSDRSATNALAETPQLFGEIRQPETRYLAIPKVSSEMRAFIPIGFEQPETIASGSLLIVPDAEIWHFAVLISTMHNAWMRAVCGRLESRYQYSAAIVYNNFPWPELTDKQQAAIEATGKAILDARALYPDSTLADLYDPLSMPPELRKAHTANDRAVDAAYGYKGDKADGARVAFLFELFGKLTSLLPTEKPKQRQK
jgi:hypothetical protein